MYARRLFFWLVAGGSLLAVSMSSPSPGLALGDRYPYYTQWYYNTDYNYHYCNYHYSPEQDSYHRVYYYPVRYYPAYYGGRRYVYYYNWSQRRYWGRMDMETGKYSLLPENKRKEKLSEISEKDFPEPVARDTITIPGSDKLKMKELPPPLPKDDKKDEKKK